MTRILLLIAAISMAFPVTLRAQDVEARIRAIEERVAPLFVIRGEPVETAPLEELMDRLGVPGVSIAVFHDGRVVWARGYGLADVGEGRRVTTHTLFQGASISKPVAATAALRLVQEGRLGLDDDVNARLASWTVPQNELTAAEPVTLRRLLTHTAGTTVHGFPGYAPGERIPSVVDVLEGRGNTDPVRVDTRPGSSWRYSGGGYTVMQLLLSDVTGRDFPTLMKELVLQPVGMTESTYEQPLPEPYHARAATAYRSDGTPVDGKWHVYPEMAAAGLWTTPTDLARFAIAIQAAHAGRPGTVLSQDVARWMLTPGLNDWGLGPTITADGDRFGHGGSNEGFRCNMTAFIAEGGAGAVIMTNSDNGDGLIRRVLATIAREYGWSGLEPPLREVVALDAADLEAVTGRYRFPGLGTVTIELVDGRIWAEAPGQARVELLPESQTRFFLRDDGSIVSFPRDAGRVVALVYGGTRAEKIE